MNDFRIRMSLLFRISFVQVLIYFIISVFALISRIDDVTSLIMGNQETRVDEVIVFFQQMKKEKNLLR